MSVKEMRVDSKNVEIGMYIARLDRPWLESSFMLQGFMIHTKEDLQLLIDNCSYCYVDVQQSKAFKPTLKQKNDVTNQNVKFLLQKNINHSDYKTSFKRKHNYNDAAKMTDELKNVRITHGTMTSTVKDMMRTLRFNKKLDLTATRKAIKPMVDSIIRNPDALLWLNRLRQLDDYNYSHALGCCIWAMSMGRQLGFNKIDIESLGLGALLLDIGKTRLPKKVLNKTERLNKNELNLIKSHVQHSLDIVTAEQRINIKIRNMIESHHERYNGSGYPIGLKNDQIPLFAKIAAIIDCYDAITSERCYAKPMSSQDAVKSLYDWRDKDFQTELVEEFIQAIGMFPAGTLVELTTGEVAVVVTESRTRRLRPKIMMLLNADKSPREDYIICNLMHETHDAHGKTLEIKQALPLGSYDIQPDDYFL